MTNKQKEWLLKIEFNFRALFPGDPFADEKTIGDMLDMVSETLKKANNNETVKRWLIELLREYENRHKVLAELPGTDWEIRNEYREQLNRLERG